MRNKTVLLAVCALGALVGCSGLGQNAQYASGYDPTPYSYGYQGEQAAAPALNGPRSATYLQGQAPAKRTAKTATRQQPTEDPSSYPPIDRSQRTSPYASTPMNVMDRGASRYDTQQGWSRGGYYGGCHYYGCYGYGSGRSDLPTTDYTPPRRK